MTAPALTQYVQGTTVLSADGLNTMQQSCDTFAQLRSFGGLAGMQIFVRGRYAPNDGYQGTFYWNASLSGVSDDNANTIIPSGVTLGGWVRIFGGPPKYTVALLPSAASLGQGTVAYATNGRNSGEGVSSGTGCLVSVNSNLVWAAVWSGVAVTA